MDELVSRLSENFRPVVANRRDQNAKALRERIELGYVHIAFTETDTEVAIKLDRKNCDVTQGDFDNGTGYIHLEGFFSLNCEKVKCVAVVNLADCGGSAKLEAANTEQYAKVIG